MAVLTDRQQVQTGRQNGAKAAARLCRVCGNQLPTAGAGHQRRRWWSRFAFLRSFSRPKV